MPIRPRQPTGVLALPFQGLCLVSPFFLWLGLAGCHFFSPCPHFFYPDVHLLLIGVYLGIHPFLLGFHFGQHYFFHVLLTDSNLISHFLQTGIHFYLVGLYFLSVVSYFSQEARHHWFNFFVVCQYNDQDPMQFPIRPLLTPDVTYLGV
jgi:hypothetical protein